MSEFLSRRHQSLTAYTPGEQPKNTAFIKLNTNESPYPATKEVIAAAAEAAAQLNLYPDPQCTALCRALAARYGVKEENILPGNGSDEILSFAFQAFCDAERPVCFPDISYGFYKVYAQLYGIPYTQIPLEEDFTINSCGYSNLNQNIVIANPNAPTGLTLPVNCIEHIVRSNPQHVVVVDEAYIDFGGESCVPLTKEYDNLLVVMTFSKSRAMAGARLGFAIGSKKLIDDLNLIKYSTNPYNINRVTMAAALATLAQDGLNRANCDAIIRTREDTKIALEQRGFAVLNSKTNFLFAAPPQMPAKEVYLQLKDRGILVRHFDAPRIGNYLRITIGTPEQMQALTNALDDIAREDGSHAQL